MCVNVSLIYRPYRYYLYTMASSEHIKGKKTVGTMQSEVKYLVKTDQ